MPENPGRVFLSYRREETRHLAGRLADRLADRVGSAQVLMDVDTIEPVVDFAVAVTRAVASCDVLIALIGRGWTTIADGRGRRRLDDPEDFVVLEIGAALEREIRVIPVLRRRAEMPGREDLPAPLQDLVRRQGVRLDHETFRYDIEALLAAVEQTLSGRFDTPSADLGASPEARPTLSSQAETCVGRGPYRNRAPPRAFHLAVVTRRDTRASTPEYPPTRRARRRRDRARCGRRSPPGQIWRAVASTVLVGRSVDDNQRSHSLADHDQARNTNAQPDRAGAARPELRRRDGSATAGRVQGRGQAAASERHRREPGRPGDCPIRKARPSLRSESNHHLDRGPANPVVVAAAIEGLSNQRDLILV